MIGVIWSGANLIGASEAYGFEDASAWAHGHSSYCFLDWINLEQHSKHCGWLDCMGALHVVTSDSSALASVNVEVGFTDTQPSKTNDSAIHLI